MEPLMLNDLLSRFQQGDRRAMARLLSYLIRGQQVAEILSALEPSDHPCRIVAITGSAGVGKSTLIGKLLPVIRRHGKKVAVLACDPQSPLTGGALLGDRFRMQLPDPDNGILIRSIATPGEHGAIHPHLPEMMDLLRRYGFDIILIETVGAGQGDTSVRQWADALVLLLQPETGDDLQWEKAGVLEVADVIAIHKGDLPGAENVEAQVKAMLELSDRPAPPVLRVSSRTGDQIEALWKAIEAIPAKALNVAPVLLRYAQDLLEERYHTLERSDNPAALQSLLAEWQQKPLTPQAAKALCDLLLS